MTGTLKMPITLSPFFDAPWRIGSFSTTLQPTVRITSNMSLQPWEPNRWRCMHSGYLLEMKRNKEWPRQKLLLSSTRYNREWHENNNTHVWLGELEDVVVRPGEDPQDLVACIKTLIDCYEMINDEHWEHELCQHIVCAHCHEGKLLDKLMAKSFKTPSSELTDIAVNHFAIKQAWQQVSHSPKPVDAIHHDKCQGAHTSCDGNGHTPPAPSRDCPNCTWQHPTGRTNCPTKDSRCSKCDRIGNWGPKCHSGKPPTAKNAPLPKNASLTGSQCGKSRCHLGATATTLTGVVKPMP